MKKRTVWLVSLLAAGFAVGAFLITATLVGVFENRQAARTPFLRTVVVSEISTDPRPWGRDFPRQFEGWKATAGDRFYGGSSAMPESKLEQQPWLKRLYAGYAFSIDYREARGHAYMLYDQGVTERVTKKPQAGACLHCHASTSVMYRKAGLEAMGKPATDEVLASSFDMSAVIRGFEEVSRKPYSEVLALVQNAPDGTPDDDSTVFPQAPYGGFTKEYAGKSVDEQQAPTTKNAHPVSCIDCHDPKTMQIRITRPGFVKGIAALAESDEPTPHLPSIEKWRASNKERPYDPNRDATRQEMRSFACGQCHVEYYCANKDVLTYPWDRGLKMEQLERVWEEKTFPDGTPFYDYEHRETGAKIFKVQHPEFELWSQGIHARSGVSCADCHMPYEKQGAMKVSNHRVDSPLNNLNTACQTCHNVREEQLVERIGRIQQTTREQLERAAGAMTDMLDAILEAKASGASETDLAPLHALQRKAMWRLDYISSENSRGFHAPQESVRILAESIDYSRQAQAGALQLRAPQPPAIEVSRDAVIGVTPAKAP